MKEYSYTVEERNERNSQFSPKHLGGFNYAGERPEGESTTSPLSSPQDKTGGASQPGYKRATATAFTYKPPEIARTTAASPSTRPLSTYRSAMNAPATTTSPSGKSSTLPSSRLRESTSAYSWSTDKEDRVRSEKAEERQFAQLINTKDVKEGGRKEKSASTDKMNALFGSGKSKKFGSSTEKQSSTTKSSIFSSFMKSSEEKVEKKKQLSQSTSNVLEQKKTSSTSSLINKYNNLTSSPIGSSGHLRPHEPPVKQIDSDSESASSSENSMDEYASEDLKTDPQTGLTSASYLTSKLGPSASLPRSPATINSLGTKTAQRYEPQPTVRTSLTIQPSSQLGGGGAVDGVASSPFSRPTTKPPITPKPAVPSKPTMTAASLTNKVSPYERQSKFGNLTTSTPSPIASQPGAQLKSSYLKDNFLKADHKPASLSPSLKPQVPIKLQSSPTTTQPSSYLAGSSGQGSPKASPSNPPSMYSPYNNALVTTTTVPHVQQPKITHLSRKRTVKNADGSIEEDEEIIEPSGLPPAPPQTYISTATFIPSKPQIVGAFPAHEQSSEADGERRNAADDHSVHRIVNRFNHITRSPNLSYSNKLVL